MTSVPANPVGVQSLSADTFVSSAMRNHSRGWHPLPVGRVEKGNDQPKYKAPWFKGLTGYDAKLTDPSEIEDWPQRIRRLIDEHGASGILSLGVRCPTDRIGIDVDQYGSKRGLDQLRELEAKYGKLPPAPVVTARELSTGSGIRLFRVPDGWHGKTQPAEHIELIQWFHRYLVVPPSFHYSGSRYQRYRCDGQLVRSGVLPESKALPMLPDDWLAGLADLKARAGASDATAQEIAAFEAKYSSGPQPMVIDAIIEKTFGSNPNQTRNALRDALCWAARESKGGRYGWRKALGKIRDAAGSAARSGDSCGHAA